MKRLIATAIFALVMVLGQVASAEEPVAADLEAALHLKILSYDRSLKKGTEPLVVGVLFKAGTESEGRGNSLFKALKQLAAKVTVHGRPVSVILVPGALTDPAKELKEKKVSVVYLAGGFNEPLGKLVETARRLKLPTLTGSSVLLDGGLAVAVVGKSGKPAIVVNMPAAHASGMDLDPRLLRVAEVRK